MKLQPWVGTGKLLSTTSSSCYILTEDILCKFHISQTSQQGKKLRNSTQQAETMPHYPSSRFKKGFQMVCSSNMRIFLEKHMFFLQNSHGPHDSAPVGRRRCFVVDPPQGVRDHDLKPASTLPWCVGTFFHWIGLRENLQEMMDFTIKYRAFRLKFPIIQFYDFSNTKAIVTRQIWYRSTDSRFKLIKLRLRRGLGRKKKWCPTRKNLAWHQGVHHIIKSHIYIYIYIYVYIYMYIYVCVCSR